MGAGLSKERQYRIVYRELHKIQRELAQNGVACRYEKRCLYGENNKRDMFGVQFKRSNASNGECFLRPVAYIVLNDVMTDYQGCEWMPEPSFRKDALPLILAHFTA